MKLDIGCGPSPKPGYIGVDLYVEGPDIIQAPMDKLPFEDNSIEEIYSSHALEHISKHLVIPTLKEWYRVLDWNGVLTIEVPDLIWVCKNWLKYQDSGWNMDAIFGDQSDPGQYHKTGFTKQIMYEYLSRAGWKGREVQSGEYFSHNQNCYVFTVVK